MSYQIQSHEQYLTDYHQSIDNPEAFWAKIATHFTWQKKWTKVLSSDFKNGKNTWFNGAKLNITENCIDRHLPEKGNQTAIIWEPNHPEEKHQEISYFELSKKVNLMAAVLKNMGVKKGDRVCIYMGMVPEIAYAVLACARIGAIHSVIFGGFSAQAIADRINDAQAEYIVTCDGGFRGAKDLALKPIVDEALLKTNSVKKVLVYKRTNLDIEMQENRDIWLHDAELNIPKDVFVSPEQMDANDPLFILYTSGSTGKPKGVVHSIAGYMVWTNYTFLNVFQYQAEQVHFCTADIGWITGHSYILYGPLSAGATSLMFEGIPTWPDASRFWQIVEKHKVNIFYTAPTAIRSLMACGPEFLNKNDLSSLKVLGSVGEPINEEAWHWLKTNIGKNNCPVVDTWWQTETGGIMLSNLAGITPEKPCFATLPLPGIVPVILDEKGKEITENNTKGNLAIKNTWPGIISTTYNDHERCINTYFAPHPNYYFTGDGCFRDKNGFYRITGRVDDVLNVSGHRIGTAELENAINQHQNIVESAVVGMPHDIKGQGIVAFVILDIITDNETLLFAELIAIVSQNIGAIAKPDRFVILSGLPKTRSGKIMRRILRKIAEGETEAIGDISTLLNPEIVEEIIRKY